MTFAKKLRYITDSHLSQAQKEHRGYEKEAKAVQAARGGLWSSTSKEHDIFIKAVSQGNQKLLDYFVKKYGEQGIKERFIDKGVYKNIFGAEFTALSASLHNFSTFSWLVNVIGAPLNIALDNGKTYLHKAAYTSYAEEYSPENIAESLKVLAVLIEKIPDINRKGEYGNTALMATAVSTKYKFRHCLRGEEARYQRFGKQWVLDERSGPVQKSQMLLNAGADKNIANDSGETFERVLETYPRQQIVPLMAQIANDLAQIFGGEPRNALDLAGLDSEEFLAEKDDELEWAAENMFPDRFREAYRAEPEIYQQKHAKRISDEYKKSRSPEALLSAR